MKAFKLFSAAVLLILTSISAFADKPDRNNNPVKHSLAIPEVNWGSPEDVLVESVRSLKNISVTTMDIIMGSPETATVLSLKNVDQVIMEIIPGNPEDVQSEYVEALRNVPLIANPDMVWGNDGDVQENSVLALRGQ
jgi:hypothetical protein